MMRYLVIEPEAEADLAQAFAWYEEQRYGLGDEFLLGVEATLASIQRWPASYPKVRGELRRATVRRFPYGLYFLIDAEAVIVLAILHAKRDPGILEQRQ